ncbi:MAG TPA: hypothetical protein ENI80_03420 [Acidiferrobacteraceae bacterium]|nr:hypothetical protein [Acidiferrobacteraceae bacterium]
MTIPSLIVLHSSDSPNGRADTVDDIRRWHTNPKIIGSGTQAQCPKCLASVDENAWRCNTCGQHFGRGWKKAGYHHVIEIDGAAMPLVELNDDEILEPWEIANGAYGYNRRSVHICMIGRDAFSYAQWLSLTDLSFQYQDQFPRAQIVGHRDLNPNKICPGFDVATWLAQGREVLEGHVL